LIFDTLTDKIKLALFYDPPYANEEQLLTYDMTLEMALFMLSHV